MPDVQLIMQILFIIFDNAVKFHKPLTERIVTVSGDGINTPSNFVVPIGTSHAKLVKEAGELKDGVVKLISGGPMMGQAMFSLDVPDNKKVLQHFQHFFMMMLLMQQ